MYSALDRGVGVLALALWSRVWVYGVYVYSLFS